MMRLATHTEVTMHVEIDHDRNKPWLATPPHVVHVTSELFSLNKQFLLD